MLVQGQGAFPGHTALFPIVPQRPERDAGCPGAAKVPGEVLVQIGVQAVERDAYLRAGIGGNFRLGIHPTRLAVQVAEDHRIIDRHGGIGIRQAMPGVLTGHEGQSGAGRTCPIA